MSAKPSGNAGLRRSRSGAPASRQIQPGTFCSYEAIEEGEARMLSLLVLVSVHLDLPWFAGALPEGQVAGR